ncbi:hypothetical protein ABB37_00143 [Leptomonas pyrrhocoris]|uniref:Uncharacterized protein n=1 Tax=Leptomonas pyrrhocoris TaxID=157538 RepID=A0A0M9G9X8_LEPPY|nr:hypothetical protein ABB37_00143 [Leptomonas pyrrhocoris]KPA85797.1 hypothetical protein ABB37_00143 [Leptomonas pyrrhocoris]|eukprot:XP_015664236.1 hypothetical protein ABB37_00143 [Leptomonas pyrrhocoris]
MKSPAAVVVAKTTTTESVELTNEDIPVSPRHPSKRMLNKEISIIMLVMAAQTITGMVKIQENSGGAELVAESHNFHDRPWLHDKSFFSASHYSSVSSLEQLPYVAMSEGISSSSAHSDASESCDDDRDEEDVAAALLASRLTIPRRANQRFAHDEDVWENIFSSLPWDAATQARELSKFHFGESLAHVTIARMPQSKTVALFIPCPEDLDGDDMAVEAELAPRLASADGASGSSGQRLFLGQLRRTGTVPMVRWLVNTVFNAPPGALVSVENRRNTRTQRGKGCAWATISDAATVERMLGAHHRLFFDTVDGVEGVWLVPEGYEDALQTEVSLRSEGSAHPKHMPRGTIVVELPASSAGKTRAAMTVEAEAAERSAGTTMSESGGAATSVCAATPPQNFVGPENEEEITVPVEKSAADDVRLFAEERFVPYRVPGVDFVRPCVYRLNPYTSMM